MMVYHIFIALLTIAFIVIGLYLIFKPNATVVKVINKKDEKKSISDMTYLEFTVYIYSNSIYPVTSYDDFEIYYIDGRYYYYYTGVDADEFYEVEEIALLDYSYTDDLLIKDPVLLSTLFECDVCGELVTDDRIYYGWYKKVGDC